MIVPVKGFITKLDTVEVRVPYNSGKLMYKGTIIGNADLYHETIGIHKAYYETGELKAIVDYNNNKIEIFSKNGETIEISTIDDRRGS